jgi:hypothetical protein
MNAPSPLLTPGHDYGPGSCLSCGGHAGSAYDDQGHETIVCTACGVVEYVVFTDDYGDPVQGFMSTNELQQLSLWEPDDGDEDIPF